MKRIFTTLIVALAAMTSFAQQTQEYFRVEFTVPITGQARGTNNSVAATMKDYYVYCNPEHEYLDFQATDNPMSFRSVSSIYNENSSFYIKNKRTTQNAVGEDAEYPYMVDRIAKITAYSIPVEKVTLVDSTTTHEITSRDFPGEMAGEMNYRGAEFTFDRLPRNVAELKTLMEDEQGNPVAARNNPLFVAAVGYLIWPRLLDCSQDCRDMWDYLYGKQHKALNTYGVSNQSFQNACIAQYDGKDDAGEWVHYNAFQFFAGATPGNSYKPNGKSYAQGPYKVRVAWDTQAPLTYDGTRRCNVAKILLFPNPDATTREEISFENPVSHNIQLRSTKNNGWFLSDGEKMYQSRGKAMYNDDF